MPYKKSEQTRRQILEVSKKLFREQGYTKTTIRQITQEAQLQSSSTLYYYFKTKEWIAHSIYHDFFGEVTNLAEKLTAGTDKPMLTLVTAMRLHFSCIFQNEASINFYLVILSSDWLMQDSIGDIQMKFLRESTNECGLEINLQEIYLCLMETLGAERALFCEYLNKSSITQDVLVNRTIHLLGRSFHVDQTYLDWTIEEADRLISTLDVSLPSVL